MNNVKKRTLTCILVFLLAAIFTACRPDDPIDETDETFLPIITDPDTGEIDEPVEVSDPEIGEDAYPTEDTAYPIDEVLSPFDEAAYPITEADLAWLFQAWQLTAYAEDGVDQDTPEKTITFNADGSYSITTDSVQETGTWTTVLLALESTLILTNDAGEIQYYEITELNQNELNLRAQVGNLIIDEEYMPTD